MLKWQHIFVIFAFLVLATGTVNAEEPEDFRFPRAPGSTQDGYPLPEAKKIVYEARTLPDLLGEVFTLAKLKLGIVTHYFTNENTIDGFFKALRTTYQGPTVISQDLMVINVTPEQIVVRMAVTDLLAWMPPQRPKNGKKPEMATPSKAQRPDWVSATQIKPKK